MSYFECQNEMRHPLPFIQALLSAVDMPISSLAHSPVSSPLSPRSNRSYLYRCCISRVSLSRIEFPEKERSLLSPLNSNDQNIDRSISSNSVGGPTHV